jgi:hypothetical protein
MAESLALTVEVDGRAGLIAYIRTALRPSYMDDSFPDHAVNLQSFSAMTIALAGATCTSSSLAATA